MTEVSNPKLEGAKRPAAPAAWLWTHKNGLQVATVGDKYPPFVTGKGNYSKVPLYFHADPDEAEWSAMQQRLGDQNETLRAQLDEAQALLREARHDLAEWVDTYDSVLSTDTYLIVEKIDSHLSASAEPSAPVEIDERASYEKAVIDSSERFHPNLEQYGDHPEAEYRDPSIEWAWGLWQARAAQARKP